MAQKRKDYALRLNKDPIGRRQIAVLRMAGFSSQQIGDLLGRHKRTIDEEFTRPEHKKLFHRFIAAVGKKQLPKENWQVIENALTKKETLKTHS